MCYIYNEKYMNSKGIFRKLKFFLSKKIRVSALSIGEKGYNITVLTAKYSNEVNRVKTVYKVIKKISSGKVILQNNCDLGHIFIKEGVRVVDRRSFFKRHFNKLSIELIKSLEFDPQILKTYIIDEENEHIDKDFVGELCLLSNQLCICTNKKNNIDEMCEDIYQKLGASVTTANIEELSNKNGIYFIFSLDINILRRIKKTSSDKLIFAFNNFDEHSTKSKTIVDGVYLELSSEIIEKLPKNTDTQALVSAMDEDNMLGFSDISLKYFLSSNMQITQNRLLKLNLLDS